MRLPVTLRQRAAMIAVDCDVDRGRRAVQQDTVPDFGSVRDIE